MDGFATLRVKTVGCDGSSVNQALIISILDTGESFYATPEFGSDEVTFAVPAEQEFLIYYSANGINRSVGPYIMADCDELNIGTIDFCGDVEQMVIHLP